jgi:hypothetical protein
MIVALQPIAIPYSRPLQHTRIPSSPVSPVTRRNQPSAKGVGKAEVIVFGSDEGQLLAASAAYVPDRRDRRLPEVLVALVPRKLVVGRR